MPEPLFFMMLQAEASNFLKRDSRTGIPVNFEKFLKAVFLTENLRWLVLHLQSIVTF